MPKLVGLKCLCGTVEGKIHVVPGSFFHVQCLCCDCQNFASYLENKEKILDKYGGTELFQTYPSFMEITNGQENIGCVQLKSKGLYRWHTTCCQMPLANTMNSSKVPFIGVSTKFMKFDNEEEKMKALGPITMKAFGKYALGEMPKDAHPKFSILYMPKILGFLLKGVFGKKHNPSPFFRERKPVVKVKILS